MCVLLYFRTLWNKDGKLIGIYAVNKKQRVGLTVCLLLKNIGQINIVYFHNASSSYLIKGMHQFGLS